MSRDIFLSKFPPFFGDGFMYKKMQLPYESEMTIMWEEQVVKAFFLCWAEAILRMVLITYV